MDPPFEQIIEEILSEQVIKKASRRDRYQSLLETFFYYFFAKDFFDNLLKRGVHQTPTSEKGSVSGAR